MNFRVQEYIRRELAALRREGLTHEEIVALVEVPPRYQRWLEYEGRDDPAFATVVRRALAYRQAMLCQLEMDRG